MLFLGVGLKSIAEENMSKKENVSEIDCSITVSFLFCLQVLSNRVSEKSECERWRKEWDGKIIDRNRRFEKNKKKFR